MTLPRFLYLGLFSISALALLAMGAFVSRIPLNDFAILSALTVLGTCWVYSINVFDLRKHIHIADLMLTGGLLLSFGAAWHGNYLTTSRLAVFAAVLGLGLLYSIPLNLSGTKYRVKELGIAKNICIGLGWGLLVLLGAHAPLDPLVISIASFASFQIIVGSVVRDIYDIELDEKAKIRSLPRRIPKNRLQPILHLMNLASVPLCALIDFSVPLLICFSFAALLRSVVIYKAYSPHAYFWTQPMNILNTVALLISLILLLP